MNIRIEGIDSAISKINAKYGNAQAKVSKGIAKGCEKVRDAAKGLAPVATGVLRDSIDFEVSGTTGVVGTNVEYAIYQEFGTYKMAAHPFLQPALEAEKGEVLEAIKDAIKNS